ncbi:hypothetical protein niasHS_007833 [Heterodera schachtii]|uniref:Secreted protein n=2 Tax=Heterodera TaxID=34509 RepID=A0ABD2JPT4_HETSC
MDNQKLLLFIAFLVNCPFCFALSTEPQNKCNNNQQIANEFAALEQRSEALSQQINEELTNGEKIDNANKSLKLVLELLKTECQLAKIASKNSCPSHSINGYLAKFCEKKTGQNLDTIEKLTEHLTDFIEKDLPKIVEAMKKTETTEIISTGGVHGTMAEILPRAKQYPNDASLQLYAEAMKALSLIGQEIEPGTAKDALTKTLTKHTVASNDGDTVTLMPSELAQIIMELWTNTIREAIANAGQEKYNYLQSLHNGTGAHLSQNRRHRRAPPVFRIPSRIILMIVVLVQMALFATVGISAMGQDTNWITMFTALFTMFFILRVRIPGQPPSPLINFSMHFNLVLPVAQTRIGVGMPFGGAAQRPPAGDDERAQHLLAMLRMFNAMNGRANRAAPSAESNRNRSADITTTTTTTPAPPTGNNGNDDRKQVEHYDPVSDTFVGAEETFVTTTTESPINWEGEGTEDSNDDTDDSLVREYGRPN